MVVLGEKMRRAPWITQPGRGGVGSTYSQEQCIHPTLLGQRERLSCMGSACRKCTCDIVGLAREPYVSCVSGFSGMMYIDSNRHDSRI
jgi:hypothetical protein